MRYSGRRWPVDLHLAPAVACLFGHPSSSIFPFKHGSLLVAWRIKIRKRKLVKIPSKKVVLKEYQKTGFLPPFFRLCIFVDDNFLLFIREGFRTGRMQLPLHTHTHTHTHTNSHSDAAGYSNSAALRRQRGPRVPLTHLHASTYVYIYIYILDNI